MTQYPQFTPHDPQTDAVARLSKQVRSLRRLAFGGVALGLLATALAAFGLARTPQVASPAATVTAPAATPASTPTPSTVTIGKPADAGAAPQGTIVLGAPGQNRPVLDIYEDFQCPACASAERTFGPQVDELVATGKAEVRYHVMSFLDHNLGNDSSTRAANGGFCAHEQGKFEAWHDTLFVTKNRPATEGDGWTDAQLRTLAGSAGLDVPAWSACVASGKYAAQVTAANDLSLKGGVNSTPTFQLNGRKVDLNAALNAGGLKAYVEANA